MMQSASEFLLGVTILIVSTELFIKQSERISLSLKLSPLIIGLTVVSIGTSLPELAVSTIAIARGNTGLAMGNIIGSNIVNIFLVFAVGILTGKLRVGTTKTQKNIYVLSAITLLFFFLNYLKIASIMAGVILLAVALIVTLEEYIWGINGRKKEDRRMIKAKAVDITPQEIGKLLGILGGIIAGGTLIVFSVESLSKILGFSTTVLGLSITAIATSLPELLTTFFSQRNHDDKITIGNVIGSNIYNISLIGGIILCLTSWSAVTVYEMMMLILATGVFAMLIVSYKGRIIPSRTGLELLVMFLIYIYFLR